MRAIENVARDDAVGKVAVVGSAIDRAGDRSFYDAVKYIIYTYVFVYMTYIREFVHIIMINIYRADSRRWKKRCTFLFTQLRRFFFFLNVYNLGAVHRTARLWKRCKIIVVQTFCFSRR